MDKDELEQTEARGRRIRAFLDDDLVKGVFQSLEISLYQAWKDAETPTHREAIFAEVRAFDTLQATLRGIVEAGDHATGMLAERETA